MFLDLPYRCPCHLSLSDPPSHFKFPPVWLAGRSLLCVPWRCSVGGRPGSTPWHCPSGTPAPLAKLGDVLEAAVYSALFSLSNGVSHFLLRLLRCHPAARQHRAQQGLPGPLQTVLLLALCPEPRVARARLLPKVSVQPPTSPLSLCSGWPSAASWN